MPQVADLKEITVETQGFQGGLNLRDAIDQLQPNELRRSENVVYDYAGGVSKRLGSRSMGPFGSGADRVISNYTYYRTSGNPQVLIHTSAGKMYVTSDVTANPIAWTQIATGLSTTVPASFETQNSICYFAEGTVMGKWTGAAYSAVVGVPAGLLYLRTWKDIMWGVGSNPDRVYVSSAGDPETWPALGFVDILHGDGDRLTGLNTDGLFLICPKNRRVQVIYDPALFSNRTADNEKGAESHFSWVHIEDKLFYLSRLGFCEWQGDTSSRIISYKIDPVFNPSILNLSALSKVFGYVIGDRCGWALPEAGSSTPTVVFEYYPRLGPVYQISGNIGPGPWTIHRMPVTTFFSVRQGATDSLYGGKSSANKVLWLFSPDGTDDGTSFSALVESAPLDFGNPIVWKYFRRVTVVGRGKFNFQLKRNYGTSIYVTVPVDLSGSAEVWNVGNWNSGVWGPDSNIKRKQLDLDAYVVALSLVISDAETSTGSQVLPMGSQDKSVTLGEWAFYQCGFDGQLLGLRGD